MKAKNFFVQTQFFRQSILLLAGLVVWLAVSGQSAKTDLQAIQSKYVQTANLWLEMEMEYYQGTQTQTTFLKKAGLRKAGNSYLSHLDDITMLMNEQFLVTVAKKDKQILYNKRTKADDAYLKKLNPASEWTIKAGDTVTFKGQENGFSVYEIRNATAAIVKTQLFVNPQTQVFNRLIYYYHSQLGGGKAVIRFTRTDFNPVFAADTFSEKQFVTVTGSQVQAAPVYQGFSVIRADENLPFPRN